VAVLYLSGDNPSAPSTSPAPAPKQNVNLNDAKALDEAYGTNGVARCGGGADDYLRSIAKYDYKWDDLGWLEFRFDHYRGFVPQPGVLIMTSDHAKLQNGFGAFQHIGLDCYYDTQAQKVLRYSTDDQ
jgi:hypothetical protein